MFSTAQNILEITKEKEEEKREEEREGEGLSFQVRDKYSEMIFRE